MSKKKMIVVVAVWAVIALALAGVMIIAAFGWLDSPFDKLMKLISGEGEEVVLLTDERPADEVEDVEVRWHAGTVRIVRSPDDRVHVVQTSRYNAKKAEYSVENGRLYIKQKNQFAFLFFGTKKSDLEINLPQKVYDEFIMKMSSGATVVEDVDAASVRLEVSSGKLTASRVTATGSASLQMSSGSMTVDSLAAGTSATVKISSGKLTLNKLTADTMDIQISSGDMVVSGSAVTGNVALRISSGKLDATGGLDAGDLSASLSSGSAKFTGAYAAISKAHTSSGSLTIVSSQVPQALDADLSSGSISVTIPGDEEFALSYRKSSGRVSVEGFSPVNEINGAYVYGNTMDPPLKYSVKLSSGSFRLAKK